MNEGRPQRRFKGVWISASIWDDPELSPTEKFLIAEVDTLCGKDEETGEEHACFAGNEHLAARLHVSGSHMRDMLADLTARGYIVRLFFTGRVTHRCINPDLSSDPAFSKRLLKRHTSANRYRKNPIPAIGQTREQVSEKSDTENPNRVTKEKTTTKSASRSLAANGDEAVHKVLVVVSSLACQEDQPDEISDKLTAEFGPFSAAQRKAIKDWIDKDSSYVLRQAEIVRSEPRQNTAKAFMAALRDDWQPPKASKPVKRPKVQPVIPDPVNPLSDEEAKRSDARLERVKTRWMQAGEDEKSQWLQQMDDAGRWYAPKNGGEPQKLFLRCLADILEPALQTAN